MNNSFIKKLKENYCYIAAPALTVAAFLVIFFRQGVVPFGNLSVEYYDMAPGSVPAFYHIWDALHRGDVALWFNWYSGLGVNNSTVPFSFFWLILLVIKRSMVNSAMTLYVVFSFALSALTSCVFLKKVTKANEFTVTALSLCYAFCSFSVLYYTNNWQDNVILFPLLLLAWHALMKKGRILPFIALIILNLLCGYYTFTLLVMYIFFFSFLYIAFVAESGTKKEASLRLGVSVALGYGISGALLVPKIIQTVSSGRFLDKTKFDFSDIISQYLVIAKTFEAEEYAHFRLLFTTMLPLAIIIAGLVAGGKKKELNKKRIAFFSLSLIMVIILAFCEGANSLMHFGDYKNFPIRMSYAFSFILIWFAAEMSEKIRLSTLRLKKENAAWLALNGIICAAVFCGIYILIRKLNSAYSDDAKAEIGIAFGIAAPVLLAVYLLFVSSKIKKLDYRVCISALMAEIMALTAIFIPYQNELYNQYEHDPAYITTASSLAKNFNIEESKTSRIKSVGTVLNCNFGTVIGRATVTDWTHLIPSNVQYALKKWSYTGEYTRLSDSGGTAFTDALLGVNHVISSQEESSSLYSKIAEKGRYRYYSSNYTMPYGVIADSSFGRLDIEKNTWQELHNEAYTALTGDGEKLIEDSGYTLTQDDGDIEYYKFSSKAGSVAYFELEGANKVKIFVNGERITVPSTMEPNNKLFPGQFNRGVLCLGEFGDAEVEVRLEFTKGKFDEKKNFRKNDYGDDAYRNQHYHSDVSLLNLERLRKVCDVANESAQGMSVTAENYTLTAENVNSSEDGRLLLLPLQYSKNSGWSATVNGKRTQLIGAGGIMSAVKLEKGINDVRLKFTPPGLKKGIIISVISIIAAALYILLERKGKRLYRIASAASYYAYSAAFAIGLALIYVIPLCFKIIYLITGK